MICGTIAAMVIERREYAIIGIPLSGWKTVVPGEKLFTRNRDSRISWFLRQIAGARHILITAKVAGPDALEIEYDAFVSPREVLDQKRNLYRTRVFMLHKELISELGELPVNKPLVHQKIRWLPSP